MGKSRLLLFTSLFFSMEFWQEQDFLFGFVVLQAGSFCLDLKVVGKIFQSEQSGGRDILVLHKHTNARVERPPHSTMFSSLSCTDTHFLSDWFVPWVSTLPQLQFLYPAPPLPAGHYEDIIVCVLVSIWAYFCVSERERVRVYHCERGLLLHLRGQVLSPSYAIWYFFTLRVTLGISVSSTALVP